MKALAPPPGREAGGLEGPPRNCEGADPADLAVFVSEIFFMVGLGTALWSRLWFAVSYTPRSFVFLKMIDQISWVVAPKKEREFLYNQFFF